MPDNEKVKKEEVRINEKIEIPVTKWYQMIDRFTSIDELLRVLIKQTSVVIDKLDIIAGIPPAPPPPPAPPIPAPLPVEVITPKVSVEYTAERPWIEEKNLAVADSDYFVDINSALGRNAHHGWVKAYTTNTGIAKFKFSPDGYHYTTNWHEDMGAGDTFDLDGMDVDTIRFQSDTAGDKIIVTAW